MIIIISDYSTLMSLKTKIKTPDFIKNVFVFFDSNRGDWRNIFKRYENIPLLKIGFFVFVSLLHKAVDCDRVCVRVTTKISYYCDRENNVEKKK